MKYEMIPSYKVIKYYSIFYLVSKIISSCLRVFVAKYEPGIWNVKRETVNHHTNIQRERKHPGNH